MDLLPLGLLCFTLLSLPNEPVIGSPNRRVAIYDRGYLGILQKVHAP
jgi:hypothetical protein